MKNILLILIPIFILIYGIFIEPNMLTVKHYRISDNKLKGIKIVFIGDLHVKPNQNKRLSKIVKIINEQQPDIVLCSGDFVNGHKANTTMPISYIAAQLKNINTKYGIYTVLGNHDWWLDGNEITKTLTLNGIKVLANSNTEVNINGKNIYIAGVEDKTTRIPKINSALKGTKHPVILLTHSPDIFPEVSSEVNLTLAGHVHGGQIRLPIFGALIVPSEYGNNYSQGLIEENGKKMIITKGIGNSILPVRFNCVPEIVVIEFE